MILTIIPLVMIICRNKLKFLIFKFFIETDNISKAYKDCKDHNHNDHKVHK
jgi:hypothetical protein